jgi:hypothetical protein
MPAFNPDFPLADTLKSLEKKRVFVHLRTGHTLQGILGDVGTEFFVLTQLAQRDFYDAIVRQGDVAAVEVQIRGV